MCLPPPLLSIITPVYNGQDHILTSINSVLNQGFSVNELEVILINDGSTDNTKSIIDEAAKKHSFIKAYHQTNKGPGITRNLSLNYASGKYIYFLDADDFLAPKSLIILINKMLDDKLELIGFKSENNYTVIPKTIPESTINKKLNETSIISGKDFIETHNFTNTVWWYICNREFLLKTNLKNSEENQLEDCVFTANLLIKTPRMMYLPLSIHNYHIRGSSIMHNNNPIHYKNMVFMYTNTAIAYGHFIDEIKLEHDDITEPILSRLKARQQWLSFFGLVRAVKSDISTKELNTMLNNMEKANAYPLNNFIGKDNNGFKLKFTSSIFSKRFLLKSILISYKLRSHIKKN
ncbi:MAG: glycosyltransferase [Algibacter sp.]